MTERSPAPTAAAQFTDAMRRAATRQLPIADLIGSAAALSEAGEVKAAAELYKTWIAFHGDNELLHAIYFNYAVALSAARDFAGAVNALSQAIRLKPDFSAAYINLGRALEDLGQGAQAVEQWLALVTKLAGVNGETVAHKVMALQQVARVFEGSRKDAQAEDALKQVLEMDAPLSAEVAQHYIALRQKQCKWPILTESERVTRKRLMTDIEPLALLSLTDDPLLHLAKAYRHGLDTVGMPKPVARPPAVQRGEGQKLRIGYVSSDLRGHAVGYGMTDVLEQHDRSQFEIFAYYCGIPHSDPTQERIKRTVDHWIDIRTLDDDRAAAKIAADGIDILVDLNGYTRDARTKVFARRPAPVAVNWFGFPNTMGTPYHHYLIADPVIVPDGDEIYCSEKVLRLPCYQANDRKRTIAPRRPTRAELGLPAEAFVYCFFNGTQKITPRAFERWMTILSRVPGSVLWMLGATDDTNARLRAMAVQRGVAGERIVFAPRASNAEHLARYPLADLFLDSLPYGAHTTAADALWMGVPVLTLRGRSFAARVCASVVSAAGLPELVCATPEAYVARAIELGRDRAQMAALKARLAAGRDTCLLFDTPKLTRGLEELYRQMMREFQHGKLPAPDLRNLDIYHEIGLGLAVENTETLSDEAYVALYRERLGEWHGHYPIPPDSRLWRGVDAAIREVGERLAVA